MILTYLVWLYLALLVAYILWTNLGLHRPWWLKALDTVSFWLFAPTLALLLLSILISQRGYRLGASLAALVFTGYFWLPFLPWDMLKRRLYRGAYPDPSRTPLRVMTANLLKSNGDGHLIAAAIAAEEPDVVALQELRPEHVQAIRDDLASTYAYQELYPGEVSEGLGLLSKAPFTSHALVPGRPGGNPTQVVQILAGNRETWLVNFHSRIPEVKLKSALGLRLPYDMDTEGRETDVRDLVQLVEGRAGNALIVGDLNTTEYCEEYRLLPGRWRDAYREVGWGPGWTYPVGVAFFGVRLPFPIFRIDYIFHRGTWRARSMRSARMPGSDHHYLIAELE